VTQPLEWDSRRSLEDHFRRHGAEVNARAVEQYLQFARTTIENGVRFTYRQTSRRRVGYYHRRSGRFVALKDDDATILSLSRRSENYVRTLPDSTYGR